jgi:hypothetical protein
MFDTDFSQHVEQICVCQQGYTTKFLLCMHVGIHSKHSFLCMPTSLHSKKLCMPTGIHNNFLLCKPVGIHSKECLIQIFPSYLEDNHNILSCFVEPPKPLLLEGSDDDVVGDDMGLPYEFYSAMMMFTLVLSKLG